MYRLNHHIWGNQDLEPSEKLLLLYLLDRSDQNGVCWPSLQTISRHTGLSRWGVQKVLKRLRDRGYLSWEQEGHSNTYRLNLDRLAKGSDQVDPQEGVGNSVAYPEEEVGNSVAGGRQLSCPPQATRLRGVGNQVAPNHPIEPPNEPPIEPPTTPPPIVPPHEAHRVEEVEEVEVKKAEPENLKTPSPSPDKRSNGASQTIPAARSGAVPVGAVLASMGGRFHSPEPPEEMVRALKGAGVWERLASLRRYARDQRAWLEWLAGPLAAMWRSAREPFPTAIGEALDALAAKPEVRDPLSYLLAVARKKLTVNGETSRSEEDPAARALRLLREGQEPSDEDLAEAFRRYGVPTKAGVGRYGGLSHDGEWVYARLNGDIIAVSKREAARRLVQGEPVEVSHAG